MNKEMIRIQCLLAGKLVRYSEFTEGVNGNGS